MESEDLEEHIKGKVEQIAAAFGAKEWGLSDEGQMELTHEYAASLSEAMWNVCLFWQLESNGEIEYISVGSSDDGFCILNSTDQGTWICSPFAPYDRLMSNGLYRLGFEDEEILSQLPPLSAHEKLELRLSMPREYWPQKWLDEEAKGTTQDN